MKSHRGPGSDAPPSALAASRSSRLAGEAPARPEEEEPPQSRPKAAAASPELGSEPAVACISVVVPETSDSLPTKPGPGIDSNGSLTTSASKGTSIGTGGNSCATIGGGGAGMQANGAPPPLADAVAGCRETLYKCAICGTFVYESELDAHVEVCPDPAEQPSGCSLGPSDDGTARSGRSLSQGVHSRMSTTPRVSTGMQRPASHSPDRRASISEAGKPWTGWQGSNIERNQAAMTQRKSMRQEQVAAELRRREEQECTFTPKKYTKLSPRSSGYVAGDYAIERSGMSKEARARERKLAKAEAQAYAEVTLHPQISPYAHAWSQRQQEIMMEGEQPPSVFERLYKAAQVQEERRVALLEESDLQRSALSSRPLSARKDSSTRRMPAGELLYSDALDRRERIKLLAQKVHAEQQSGHDSTAVLSRSRRYYWQMLERQIKTAFDHAADGLPVMRFEMLDDFLVKFGCKRSSRDCCSQGGSPPKGGSPLTQADTESQRLCRALWVHLDPDRTGQVDLLTITVFFHVLMGAVDMVDDAARERGSLLPGQSTLSEESAIACPSTPPPRSSGGGQATPPATGGSNPVPALEAICEEDGAIAKSARPSPRTSSPPSRSGSPRAVAAPGDDEGNRICELLLRYDPHRLRAEFHTLYMQRMHYQGQSQSSRTPESPEQLVQAPVIDQKSKKMAEAAMERQRGEGNVPLSHPEMLHRWHSQVEARKEERRVQSKIEETSGCTFRPKTLQKGKAAVTVKGATRNEVLYVKGLVDKERRKTQVQEAAKEQMDAEVAGCTFTPNTNRSRTSYKKTTDVTTPVPRGFYESRQRMRAANAVQAQKREQRENRLAKLTPVTATAANSAQDQVLANLVLQDAGFANISDELELGIASQTLLDQQRSPPPAASIACSATSSRALAAQKGTAAKSPRSSDPSRAGSKVSVDGQDAAAEPQGTSSTSPPATSAKEDLPPPLLYVDVNIFEGQQPERIVVREGQPVSEVAADFAAKHRLKWEQAQRLHSLLNEVMNRQQSTPQPTV